MDTYRKIKMKSIIHRNSVIISMFVFNFISLLSSQNLHAADQSYLEPGSLRLTHNLILESVLHQLEPGWTVTKSPTDSRNKVYSKVDSQSRSWTGETGERLVTEAATNLNDIISGRVLFEAQGEYADRYWRPINVEHEAKNKDDILILRQAEGFVKQDSWSLHGFSGVGHGNWSDKGDFFNLYGDAYPDSDYLGSSGYFGIYPESWKQDQFLNISKRIVPQGVEGAADLNGVELGAVYGNEVVWGYKKSFYGRVGVPLKSTNLTFIYKDELVPASFYSEHERKQAYELSWMVPFENGHRIDVGVLYQPFRVGKNYLVDDTVSDGSGILGSSHVISEKKAKKSDAFAERLRLERNQELFNRLWNASIDLTHAGVLAGNKNEATTALGTNITPDFQWKTSYTYRKPVEGPIPFLHEGTIDNLGAIISNPRGPESPFTVNWDNREAVFLTSTFWFDPTPGTNLFLNDPTNLSGWNINPKEDAPFAFAIQHKMSDYKTTTDRQYYYNTFGEIVWEPAAKNGAWASAHPLNEIKILTHGVKGKLGWTLGFAGGQAPAVSGLAYNNTTIHEKPLTEYASIEGGLQRWPFSIWAHYGSGVWGPEYNIHPFFGETYDQLWGLGFRTNFTVNTTLDINYLAARQDDSMYLSPTLGSFNEIRTVFSHKFGFLVQFDRPASRGYKPK